MRLTIIVLLMAMLCGNSAMAQHAGIPHAATAAFTKSYPGAQKVKWDKENKQYEASFLYQHQNLSVLYNAGGSVVETEVKIPVDELPAAVRRQAMAKGRIKEAARITRASGQLFYEAEVKGKDLLYDSNGNFLQPENGPED